MEKRLKYILGCLVVGFGLLFNQSFADNYYFEGVTLPLTNSNLLSSSYLYTFISNGQFQAPYFGYTLYYDGLTHENITQQSCGGSVCTNVPIHQFNNSIYGLELLNDVIYHNSRNGWNVNNSSMWNNGVSIYIGQGDQFGKNFIFAGSPLYDNTGTYSAHYSLGNGFLSSPSYLAINSSLSNFYRIFFDQNINLSSPLDGYSIVTGSGSNITGSTARMYFTQNTPRFQTKYNDQPKYFIDYGGQGLKGLHFGGYGMGYSYGINFASDEETFYWGNWSFGSVGSVCGQSAMQLGLVDFDTLSSNNCLNLGLLVLKGDSYVSRQNNGSVLVLGKNPNNLKQILYEQYDCAQDDIIRVMDSSFCTPISHGYITYNGSGDLLPFNSKQDTYVLGNGNAFLDFLFTNGIYGYMSMTSNQYCMNSPNGSFCFGLHATPNLKSLKEMYLESSGDLAGFGGTVGGEGLIDVVINNPTSYYTYSGLLEYTMQGNYYVEEDSGYLDNYVDYTFINGVPQLKNLKFGVCPFTTNPNFATLGLQDFSFDMLVPHKCILAGLQVGYTSVNMSGFNNLNLPSKFINSNLNNENVELIGHFVAILLILGISTLLFYFLKLFK